MELLLTKKTNKELLLNSIISKFEDLTNSFQKSYIISYVYIIYFSFNFLPELKWEYFREDFICKEVFFNLIKN